MEGTYCCLRVDNSYFDKLLVLDFIFGRASDLYLCLYNQLFVLLHYVLIFNTLKL
jgi:hypothetical protein